MCYKKKSSLYSKLYKHPHNCDHVTFGKNGQMGNLGYCLVHPVMVYWWHCNTADANCTYCALVGIVECSLAEIRSLFHISDLLLI